MNAPLKKKSWEEEFNELSDATDDTGTAEAKVSDGESFEDLLNSSTGKKGKSKYRNGDKVTAEVLLIGKEQIFVSLTSQQDGIILRQDALNEAGEIGFKKGDKLPLYVTQVKGGEVFLSLKPTSKNLGDNIREAYQQRQTVEGKVVEVCNGGVRVSILGKLAFCPISQLDTKRVEKGDEYIGKKLEFRITQLTEGGKNIVVSARQLMEEQRGAQEASFLSERRVGDILQGKVTRLEKFGAFIEIAPGLDGLAHISELSWSRVNDPAEVLQVGQTVPVKILKIENPPGERVKLGLSIKQAGATPWESLPGDIRVGQVVAGKVTRCMKFGAFVELVPGVEGLVPLSEMSYTKRVMHPEDVVKEGERITVMVKELNSETKKILLSIKDAGQDPWALVFQKFPVGSVHKGKFERKENYGLFIQLEEGVVGLLPKSRYAEASEFAHEKLRKGDEVVVQVAEVKQDERRISLALPGDQSADDWKNYAPKGSAGGALNSPFSGLGDALKKAQAAKKK